MAVAAAPALATDDSAAAEVPAVVASPAVVGALATLVGLFTAGVAVVAWFACRPSAAAGVFHSDHAIPVFMSNAETVTPFGLYYYGQDRFGGWPYLLARALRDLVGGWTPDTLHAFHTALLALGAFPAWRLGGAFGGVAAAAYLLATFGNPGARATLLDLSQPYAFQVTSLLFGWWAVRAYVDRLGTGARRVAWAGALAALAAMPSVWMSMASVPILAVIGAVEAVLRPGAASTRVVAIRAAAGFVPAIGALILEAIPRNLFHGYADRQDYVVQFTATDLDLGHLGENLARQVGAVFTTGWSWPPVAALIVLPLLILYRARLPASLARFAIAATAGGSAYLVLLVLLSWPRLNDYSPRYLAPAQALWTLGAVLGLLALVAPKLRRVDLVQLALVPVLGAGALGALPTIDESASFRGLRKTAAELERRAPNAVLLGGYWGTYVLAGLAPGSTLVPVPAEKILNRTPWTSRALRTAPNVIVTHHRWDPAAATLPFLFQYGVPLGLAEASFLPHAEFTFSRYEDLRPRALPFTVDGVEVGSGSAFAAPLPLPVHESRLRIEFEPRASGRLVLFGDEETLPALTVSAPQEGVELQLAQRQHVATIAFDSAASVSGVDVRLAAPVLPGAPLPRLRAALLLPAD